MDLREIAESLYGVVELDIKSGMPGHFTIQDSMLPQLEALRSVAPRWVPIETAPKDGRWILAWDLKHQWRDRPPVVVVRAKRPQGLWQDKDDTSYGNLTHYMPLPPPPEERK